MRLEKDIDIALAEYMYDEYIVKGIQHTYKDAAAAISKTLGREVDPHMGLPHPLGRLSVFCFEELDLPLISVGIYSNSLQNPGDGFYKLARDYRPEYISMTPKEAIRLEHKKVRDCTNWQRLRDYLDGISVDTIMQKPRASKTEPTFPDENKNIVEGAKKQTIIDIRERNPEARRKCIEHWGTACAVCGVDFGREYGVEFQGKIHVHHLKPLALYDGEHDVSPIEDLRPVCPNCHMIIHCKEDKPFTIEQVKAMIYNSHEHMLK